MRGRLLTLLLVLAVAVARVGEGSKAAAPVARLPNVLLVTIDIMQEKYVNDPLLGQVTPTTRRLAREGTSFVSAYAHTGHTGTASRSLLTSRYMGQELATGAAEMPPALQDILAAKGYATGAFLSWCVYLVPFHRQRFAHGFSVFDCPSVERRDGDETTRLAIDWMRSVNAKGPWFAWVMYWDAHPWRDQPFDPARQLRRDDDLVATLLEAIRSMHADNDTIVVITGIHGHNDPPVLYELSEKRLRVPLVFWAPGRVPAGRQVDTLVGHVDVVPTLLALLGLAPLPSAQGSDLFAPLSADRPVFADTAFMQTVRQGRWKLVEWQSGTRLEPDRMAGGRVRMPVPAGARKATLYDVSTDEINDVFDAHPDEARRLHDLLLGIRAPATASPVPTPDAALMKSLRQQGYW